MSFHSAILPVREDDMVILLKIQGDMYMVKRVEGKMTVDEFFSGIRKAFGLENGFWKVVNPRGLF